MRDTSLCLWRDNSMSSLLKQLGLLTGSTEAFNLAPNQVIMQGLFGFSIGSSSQVLKENLVDDGEFSLDFVYVVYR